MRELLPETDAYAYFARALRIVSCQIWSGPYRSRLISQAVVKMTRFVFTSVTFLYIRSVDAALSVPTGYEELVWKIRENVVVPDDSLSPIITKKCDSLEGPFCQHLHLNQGLKEVGLIDGEHALPERIQHESWARSATRLKESTYLADSVLSKKLFPTKVGMVDALSTLNEYLQQNSDSLFQEVLAQKRSGDEEPSDPGGGKEKIPLQGTKEDVPDLHFP